MGVDVFDMVMAVFISIALAWIGAGPTRGIYFTKLGLFNVGAVGLISIHLAFYQMNPWPTALRRFINLWKSTSSTPVEIFCFLLGISKIKSHNCFLRALQLYVSFG